jgi:hypothetical protein
MLGRSQTAAASLSDPPGLSERIDTPRATHSTCQSLKRGTLSCCASRSAQPKQRVELVGWGIFPRQSTPQPVVVIKLPEIAPRSLIPGSSQPCHLSQRRTKINYVPFPYST